VVAFRLRQQRDTHDESERAAEVVERKLAGQAAGAVALPARDLSTEPSDLCLWERWRPGRVLLAVVVDKLGNGRTVLMKSAPQVSELLRFVGRLTWLKVAYAELRLLNGDLFTVEGALDQVERKLSDAARSGQSRLAWFTEYGTDESVGVNPAHVASLKLSDISDN
jgi:hypothetical protein